MNTEDDLVISCAHCKGTIVVNKKDINCKQFVHATYKDNQLKPVNPHASKQQCEELKAKDEVYGCANAFALVQDDDGSWKSVVREYG